MTYMKRLALLLTLAVVLAACGSEDSAADMEEMDEMDDMAMSSAPDDLDLSTEKMTEAEHFMASVTSELEPLALNEIHNWTLHLETPDGAPVEGATVLVDGGMPEHNHGFPTDPEVTQELGDGDYLIEGVKFSMGGWWELKLNIEADGQTDNVTFNLVLP